MPECLGSLEVGVAATHLIAEPRVPAPPRVPILDACDAAAAVRQEVDREVERYL
jgi:hypothetical protein